MKQIAYEYKNLPIPGGGYVTGFLYHKKEKDLLYVRTDIGGTYRFDTENQRWISLIPHVTMEDLSESFPISVAVDDNRPEMLYIACGVNAEKSGVLAISEDYGESFRYERIPVMVHGNLIVGTAGVTTMDEQKNMRGHSLYVSYDKGASFEKMPQPESRKIDGCRLDGLVAQRWCVDERYLYITFASTGRLSYVLKNGYSCDSGDTIDGRIARYEFDTNGKIGAFCEITPISQSPVLDYGFSGISTSLQTHGLLLASTIAKDDGDSVFLSRDYGASWQQILYDLEVGEIRFRAPYMRPECNGGHSLIHWLSDIQINPFDDNEAWFNTGTGVFRTQNLKDKDCFFTDWNDGLEETVHLNVYSMPKGDIQVIDILGDLGGFAFADLDTPCDNSFADDEGNRYITCINADFSDEHPEWLVVTPRGNWTGKTKGGLILSKDQGKTFERLAMPFGLTKDLDEALHNMECPNVNSGWVAMSPDGSNIVWAVAEGIELPVVRLMVSQDGGKTFQCCKVYEKSGAQKLTGKVKVYSDRVDSRLFYGFGEQSDFYISKDGGCTYQEYDLPVEFPKVNFGLIDCANKTEVRGETGKKGVFYLAVGEGGLWKLIFDEETDSVSMKRLSKDVDVVYRVGLGLGSPDGDYYKDNKAIYCNAVMDGEYGFYRTFDDGETYERINTDRQMFGDINSIDGDCRVFGRFYLATGSNGVKYGTQICV